MNDAAVTPDEITGKAFRSLLPVCPHCGMDPALLSGVVTKLGATMAIVFFCANPECRRIHGVAPTVAAPAVERPERRRPGIWVP